MKPVARLNVDNADGNGMKPECLEYELHAWLAPC